MLTIFLLFLFIASVISPYTIRTDNYPIQSRHLLSTEEIKSFYPPPRDSDYGAIVGHVTPSFDNTYPKNVTAQLGQTAYLHCVVNNLGDKVVSWVRRRDFRILTLGLETYISDHRFEAIHMERNNDWTLKVKFAQLKDAGLYECQVNSQPKISLFVELSVVVAKAEISGPHPMFVKTGNSINLTCIITHSPEPPAFLFWYQDDRILNYDFSRGEITMQRGDSSVSTLYIKDASVDDSGNYTCMPSNSETTSISVYVLKVPKAEISGPHPLFVETGSSINLTCIITQSPEPPVFVFWYHDDRMINYDTSRGQITLQQSTGDSAISRLYIEDASADDSGNYTCMPSNSETTSISVYILKRTYGACRICCFLFLVLRHNLTNFLF